MLACASATLAGKPLPPGGPSGKLRIMRDTTIASHFKDLYCQEVYRETAAAGFNVLSLPNHKDFQGVRRRADLCASWGMYYLQWLRGTFGADRKNRPETCYVWPNGHVSRLLSPNSEEFWREMRKYLLEYARISVKQPAMMGVFFDFEPYDYPAWGMTYPLSYDRKIVDEFAQARGVTIPELEPARRKPWLEKNKLHKAFHEFQVAQWRKRCRELRRDIDKINPYFRIVIYPRIWASPFLAEAAGPEWGTRKAPLVVADPGDYGERLNHESFRHALDRRYRQFRQRKKKVQEICGPGKGLLLEGLDPIGRRGEPEHFARNAVMMCDAVDGYWVFYEGPAYDGKSRFDPNSGPHKDYYIWFARANQAIIDGNLKMWKQPRTTPVIFKRTPKHPDRLQLANSTVPFTFSVTEYLKDTGDWECVELVENYHLDRRYLENFDVIYLKNLNAGPTDRKWVIEQIRQYVGGGGGVLLNIDQPWLRKSPFPEIARFPEPEKTAGGKTRLFPKYKGPLRVAANHKALGTVKKDQTFSPYYPPYNTYRVGPKGTVLIVDDQGRAVFVAGRYGKGRVVFAGVNFPRPSTIRHYYNVPIDQLPNKDLRVFYESHRGPWYPPGTERDILLGLMNWLAGKKPGALATPPKRKR